MNMMDPRTVARILKRNSVLERRNKDLATKVAQLEASRDMWKRKAVARSRANIFRRRQVRRQNGMLWSENLTPDEINLKVAQHRRIVNRILTIPPRDIQ